MPKDQTDLAAALKDAKARVRIGGEYAHYKDVTKRYTVENVAINVDTDEPCVVYRARYGERLLFARSLAEWCDVVEKDGKKMSRFTLVV